MGFKWQLTGVCSIPLLKQTVQVQGRPEPDQRYETPSPRQTGKASSTYRNAPSQISELGGLYGAGSNLLIESNDRLALVFGPLALKQLAYFLAGLSFP